MAIHKLGTDALGREFAIVGIPSFAEWQSIPFEETQGFCLFLACDASDTDTAALADIAKYAIERGCAAACIWGRDCERVHEMFDEDKVELMLQDDKYRAGVLMTTWHAEDPLDDALHYFRLASVDEDYLFQPKIWLAVSVGSASQLAQIRAIIEGVLKRD